MKKVSLAIAGLGNVGRRLLELIEQKRVAIQERFGVDLIIAGVCDTSGALINPHGISPNDIIVIKEQKKGVAGLPGSVPGMILPEFLEAVQANILIELTLTNLKSGEPGLSAMRTAFAKKMHVVTANKGPLVLAYSELAEMAGTNGVKFLHSATVTGGLPTLNLGMRDLCAASVHKIEGVFNGTTNYILTRMSEGESFGDALKYAQEIGMAEADPSLDVDGWDAACKLVIVANSVLRHPASLGDVAVQGIRDISGQQLIEAAANKRVLKLVACAIRTDRGFELSVRPTLLEPSHPLAHVGANMMAVLYHTDINGTIFASIVEADPYPTAAGVLRDIIHTI